MTRVGGKIAAQAQFEILGPETQVALESVTAVCVLPVTSDGQIVAIQNSRGIDIPGGHVEEEDTSLEDAARREAMEEAGIALSDLRLIAYLRSSVPRPNGSPTHIAIFRGMAELLPTGPQLRTMLPVAEFLRAYSAGDPALLRELLRLAAIPS